MPKEPEEFEQEIGGCLVAFQFAGHENQKVLRDVRDILYAAYGERLQKEESKTKRDE